MPDITAVLTTCFLPEYNGMERADMAAQTISNLWDCALNSSGNFRVIVADDCSSIPYWNRFVAQCEYQFEAITNDKPVGVGGTLN